MIPKFRAFYENEMRDVLRLSFEEKRVKFGNVGFLPTKYVKLDEVFLMQSTGLKDKNGVEIFEGDILSWPNQKNVEVIFKNGQFSIVLPQDRDDTLWLAVFIKGVGGTSVIGNIYENPELLEDTNA